MSILSSAQSLGSSDSLQKVQIDYEVGEPGKYVGHIKAMFNPALLKFSKEVAWELVPVAGQPVMAGHHRLRFHESKPATLTIELFFDTYEGAPAARLAGQDDIVRSAGRLMAAASPILPPVSGVDVSQYTRRVARLAAVDRELHRPPRCKVRWGKFVLLEGVLVSLKEDYTFFLPDGTPVRAVLGCTFTEVLDEQSSQGYNELHSADVVKQWVIKRGDTLSGIAHSSYGDANKWRLIAQQNQIDDPRRLQVGRVLTIPTVPLED